MKTCFISESVQADKGARVGFQVSLMDDAGNTKDDLKLPKGTDEAEKLAVNIQAEFDDGKELVVVVLKVLTSPPPHPHECARGLAKM